MKPEIFYQESQRKNKFDGCIVITSETNPKYEIIEDLDGLTSGKLDKKSGEYIIWDFSCNEPVGFYTPCGIISTGRGMLPFTVYGLRKFRGTLEELIYRSLLKRNHPHMFNK
jgi:hypothetical protein